MSKFNSIVSGVRLLVWGVLLSSTALRADDLTELLDLLEATRSSEQGRGFEWEFEYHQYVLPAPEIPRPETFAEFMSERATMAFTIAEEDSNESFRGKGRWDPATSQFYLSANHVQKWLSGAAPYVATRETVTFDGESTWDIQTIKPGNSLPLEDFTQGADPEQDWFPNGSISHGAPGHKRTAQLLAASGYWFRRGYFALPQSRTWGESVEVAGFLRELRNGGHELRITDSGADRKIVSFAIPASNGGVPEGGEIDIVFRIDQLGAVEEVRHVGSHGRALLASFQIRNGEVAPGIWFPTEITWGNWLNTRVIRTVIQNAKLRSDLKKADFQIDFPVGTRVADHRQQVNFVASAHPVDQDRAIREYAATYLGDLKALSRRSAAPERPFFRIVIVVGSTVAAIFVMYLLWRSRGARRFTAGSMFMCAVTLFQPASAQENANAPTGGLTWAAEKGWVLDSGEDGVQIGVSQCGFHAVELALAAFARQSDPINVCQYLRPTSSGVSLKQIVKLLQAFQIVADVRSEVSWEDLKRDLPQGILAIVAIPPQQHAGGHFVVAVRQPNGEILIHDAPFGMKALSTGATPEFRRKCLAVAFLSESESLSPVPISELVVPESVKVQTDPANPNWTSPIRAGINVRNRGPKGHWLYPIKPICGCVRIVHQPSFVESSETATIQIEILPARWGVGHQKKAIVLTAAGHGELTVTLEGTLIAEEAARPDPDNGLHVIRLPVQFNDDELHQQVEFMLSSVSAIGNATVTKGKGWCDARVDRDLKLALVNVRLSRAQLCRIRSGEVLYALVEVSGTALYHTFQVQVLQDLSQIQFDKTVYPTEEAQVTVSGTLGSDFDDLWEARIKRAPAAYLSDSCRWTRNKSGAWALTIALDQKVLRPFPIRLEFVHPLLLPIEQTIVVIPQPESQVL